MPYHVGEKGSNGCSGYPVVADNGHVMGCHPTATNAQEQVAALYAAGAAEKGNNIMSNSEVIKEYKGCGCPTCKEMNVDCLDCPVCSADIGKAVLPPTCDCPDCQGNCDCGDCVQCATDKMGKNNSVTTTKSLWGGNFFPRA